MDMNSKEEYICFFNLSTPIPEGAATSIVFIEPQSFFIFLMSSFSAYFVWFVSTKGDGVLQDPSSWNGADPGFGSGTIFVVGFIGIWYVLSQVKSR